MQTKNNYIIRDTLKVKLAPNAFFPKYENLTTTNLFLQANENVEILPKTCQTVSTGVSIELVTNVIMDIQVGQIEALLNKNLYILNHPGTIDRDYRGEIKVILYNFGKKSVNIIISDIICRLSFNMIKKTQLELYTIKI
jgi:dUTP pyrophosphatase